MKENVYLDGKITMHNAVEGVWAIGRSQQSEDLVIAVSWECVNKQSSGYQYLARRSAADPGRKHWNELLIEFTRRFRCTNTKPK